MGGSVGRAGKKERNLIVQVMDNSNLGGFKLFSPYHWGGTLFMEIWEGDDRI